MKVINKLLELMYEQAYKVKPEDFIPVAREEIATFTQQYGVNISEEHIQYLMRYGNAYMTKYYYDEISFKEFCDYYRAKVDGMLDPEQINPVGGGIYFGQYHGIEYMALFEDNTLGDVEENPSLIYYRNIASLLLSEFLGCNQRYQLFSHSLDRQIIFTENEKKEFIKNYEPYRLGEVCSIDSRFHMDFYYTGDKLIKFYSELCYKEYSGDILDRLKLRLNH